MNTKTPRCHGYRFPPEIISHAAMNQYFADSLSLAAVKRQAGDLLFRKPER